MSEKASDFQKQVLLQAPSSSCPVPGAGGQSREGVVHLVQGKGISQPAHHRVRTDGAACAVRAATSP